MRKMQKMIKTLRNLAEPCGTLRNLAEYCGFVVFHFAPNSGLKFNAMYNNNEWRCCINI